MIKSPHILIIEDQETHALLIKRAFESMGRSYRVTIASNLKDARAHCDVDMPDLILTDWLLPDGKGTDILHKDEMWPPVMIMTSHGDESVAVEAIKAGALDYVIKTPETLSDMPHIVERALREWAHIVERRRAETALHESENRYRTLFENTAHPIMLVDYEGNYIDCNDAALTFLETTRQELLTRNVRDYVVPSSDPKEIMAEHQPLWETGGTIETEYFVNGSVKVLELTITIIEYRGRRALYGIGKDITEHKRAEAALRESENRYRRIVETAQEGIWTIDKNGQTTFVNQKMADMLGYTVDDMEGRALAFFMDEKAREKLAFYQKRREDGISEQHEFHFRHRDGSDVYTLISASPIIEEGEYVGALAMIADITERRHAQDAQSRLAAIVESSDAAIIGKSLDGTIASWNRGAERIYGYTSDDIIGKSISILVPPEGHDEIAFILKNVGQGKHVSYYDSEHVHRGGQVIHVSLTISPVRDSNGEIVGVSTIARDITERRNAEEERARLTAELQKQARQTQQIIDTVPEGVLLLNAHRRIILANPMAANYLADLAGADVGSTLTTLAGKPIDEFLQAPPEGLWHEAESQERAFEIAARPIESSAAPDNWVLVIRDVTREREIQGQIQQRDRLAAVGQLAAGIAHDFNNIIAVIILYVQILLRTVELPPRAVERLDTIAEQAKRATDLIEQILDFSRRAVVERRPLDLMPFLKEQAKLFERILPENIRVQMDYGADDYTVSADLTRIQQAIMNLVVNARDAMPKGGDLTIGLERFVLGPDDPVFFPEMEAGEWVRVTVSDTGTGIPPDVLPHIYEPFFTTKPHGKGAGLGLPQVYGIVKQHEGAIDVKTVPGEGTTFIIYLPALAKDAMQQPAPTPQEIRRGSGEVILVVEDDHAAREVLVDSLDFLNYRVLTATNGSEALEILCAQDGQNIALVLSDVIMPEMGGIALFYALKERGCPAKLVLLTGHTLDAQQPDELSKLEAAGLAGWLRKPPELSTLARVIHEALQNHQGD